MQDQSKATSIQIAPPMELPASVEVFVPGSKSINNRLLILKKLYFPSLQIEDSSTANDTLLLEQILDNGLTQGSVNVQDAGTVFRFLTALYACTSSNVILHGTARLQQRPIKDLVEMLLQMGCIINYKEKNGFAPLEIKGITPKGAITIKPSGNISSQFYSALAMVAPLCMEGLHIQLPETLGSKSYWEMTLECMQKLEIPVIKKSDTLFYFPNFQTQNTPKIISVERDWSAASYWYFLPLLLPNTKVTVKHLRLDSLQGDSLFLKNLADTIGLQLQQQEDNLSISKKADSSLGVLHLDFSQNPDISLNVIVALSLLQIDCTFTGLESLSVKESDRTQALQIELSKIGIHFYFHDNRWVLETKELYFPCKLSFSTYHDHRVAMALSYIGFFAPIQIQNPSVVNKSYPGFWQELGKMF